MLIKAPTMADMTASKEHRSWWRPWAWNLRGRSKAPIAYAERSSPKELVAMQNANRAGRQQQRHAAFAELFTSITKRYGGESRRMRRRMARDGSRRAFRNWKEIVAATAANAAKEKAIGENA